MPVTVAAALIREEDAEFLEARAAQLDREGDTAGARALRTAATMLRNRASLEGREAALWRRSPWMP